MFNALINGVACACPWTRHDTNKDGISVHETNTATATKCGRPIKSKRDFAGTSKRCNPRFNNTQQKEDKAAISPMVAFLLDSARCICRLINQIQSSLKRAPEREERRGCIRLSTGNTFCNSPSGIIVSRERWLSPNHRFGSLRAVACLYVTYTILLTIQG